MQALGTPGRYLAEPVEPPFILMEDEPGSGEFVPMPWAGGRFRVQFGANDRIPTAEIEVSLADPDELQSTPPGSDNQLKDWLIRGPHARRFSVQNDLLGGRRVRISTLRGGGLDWVIFEGFIDRAELGFSGTNRVRARTLKISATHTVVAADREPEQQLWGQWRRHWKSHKALLEGGSGEDVLECVRTGVPLVFNPNGRANCDPRPLEFLDGTKVYIPTDAVGEPDAIPWTVAKMLRYVQWCALQPAPPMSSLPTDKYDQVYKSLKWGVEVRKDHWTQYEIQHANLNELLAADVGGTPVLEHDPAEAGPIGLMTLLRALPSVSIDGFSVLEAFAYICDRAGMMIDAMHATDHTGRPRPYVKFSIRGHHKTMDAPGGGDPQGTDVIGFEPDAHGAVTRVVDVRLPADGITGVGKTQVEMVDAATVTEGVIQFDESARRSQVRVQGDQTQHEVTVELKPGWLPDDWWDIDFNDPGAVQVAKDRLATPAWETRHLLDRCSAEHAKIGRYWVLNEDGWFLPTFYKRTYGPWNTAAAWAPFNFRTDAGLEELAARGDEGWSVRRRKLLPLIAKTSEAREAEEFGWLWGLSFDSGTTWYRMSVAPQVEPDRCGLLFAVNDLRAIRNPGNASDDFVIAYIEGRARVVVTAMVEGDDVTYGAARPIAGEFDQPWIESLDRRGDYKRLMRTKANSVLIPQGFTNPADRDDSGQADALCERLRHEFATQRVAGQVSVPYLLEPANDVDWPTYMIGDELRAVITGDADTRIDLMTGSLAEARGPVVVGLAFSWSQDPPEASTTVHFEDESYGPESYSGRDEVR